MCVPFDGIVVKSVVEELSNKILNGRIEKIFQPESDEILVNIRANRKNFKLVLSASANSPRIHLTNVTKENPSSPPMFCMLLRKHLSGGKIADIKFHDYERIITILVESVDELGDLSVKKLIIEIMGRHSNIILVNKEDKIIDSIKHVDSEVSSVREVMPARPYTMPPGQDKISPDKVDVHSLLQSGRSIFNISIKKYLLNNVKGFSPLLCNEICFRANVDGKTPVSSLSSYELESLASNFKQVTHLILNRKYSPCIAFRDNLKLNPEDFHCLHLYQYKNIKLFDSINEMLDNFYSEKDNAERLKQKKSALFKIINNSIDRCNKKIALHEEKLREVSDREKLKLYGELITANIYSIPKNSKSVRLLNYYSDKEEYVEISLDENLSPQKNAQNYFKKYAKAKNAFEHVNKQLKETQKELNYLESVYHMLESCTTVQEIDEIKEELSEQGYINIKKKSRQKKDDRPSFPLHYKSTEGFDIYAGKNNKQNDYLTLKMASANDIWMHTKDIPGSHVIIKKRGKEITDTALEEAAILAAYHSKAKYSSNVPVDYTMVKNVRKPNKAKPGMVIYENYKTIVVTPDEDKIKVLKQNRKK